jgi:hypothetical protein
LWKIANRAILFGSPKDSWRAHAGIYSFRSFRTCETVCFLAPGHKEIMRAHSAHIRIFAPVADLLRRGAGRFVRTPARKPAPQTITLPAHKPASDQWSRVAGILFEAQSSAGRAVENHRSASAQIDAATYALQRLREEMAPAFQLTVARPAPIAPTPLRREPFRRSEPLAA